jgi:hypothetical protein
VRKPRREGGGANRKPYSFGLSVLYSLESSIILTSTKIFFYNAYRIKRSIPMAKVSAYHTNSVEEPPKNREVYHDHDDCFEGKKIQKKHWENGNGGKPRCKECIKLG